MDRDPSPARSQTERLAAFIDLCLENPPAYRLFAMLAAISELDGEVRSGYVAALRASSQYTDAETAALERLIANGVTRRLQDAVDQVRSERLRREIDRLVID